jgi:hypothetical protein
MKFLASVIALLFLCTLSHAQAGGYISPPTMVNSFAMSGHPEHAAPHALGDEQSLLPPNVETSAHGEMPAEDVPSDPKPFVLLGDIARAYREGRAVRHAKIVWMPWE